MQESLRNLPVESTIETDKRPPQRKHYHSLAVDLAYLPRVLFGCVPTLKRMKVCIHSARPDADAGRLCLDKNGFQLMKHETMLSTDDFYKDTKKVISVYYREVQEMVLGLTGASKVVCLHYTLRNAETSKTDANIDGYTEVVHSDFGSKHDEICTDNLFPGFQGGRVQVMNIWRNISEANAVQNDHLSVCDVKSVSSADVVPRGLVMHLRPNEKHSWHYFPDMVKSEVLVFKQYDSDPGMAWPTFHTSFKDPASPLHVPPRESIEVRVIAFHELPLHQVNRAAAAREKQGWLHGLA